MKRGLVGKLLLGMLLGLLALCGLGTLSAYLSNRGVAQQSAQREVLGVQEKAQLAEFIHLRADLGDEVWPGFGADSGPVILYNEDHAFLVGVKDPPDGWVKVPETRVRGGAWQAVPDDLYDGQTYYRQSVADPGKEIGAFTVKIGDEYAACLPTLEWMRIGLANQVRNDLPAALKEVFPYRIFPMGTFTADWHVIGLAHEAFHAFQAARAPQSLDAAEQAERSLGQEYEQAAEGMQDDWKIEFSLLRQAMDEGNDKALAVLARRFLEQRAERRSLAGLSADLAQYEREREWLEGLAKYAELELWRAGNQRVGGYQPLAAAPGLESVEGYRNFQRNWDEQVRLLGQQATNPGDMRFYYSGWVQAEMLDRLAPGWKESAFEPRKNLEDLLAEAVEGK